MKVWIVGRSLEVLVNHGKVRVIIRDGKGPSIIEECPVNEITIEETLTDLSAGQERG